MAKTASNATKGPKLEGVKFTTPTFRVSFPQLHEPKAWKDKQTPKFSVTALWPADMDRKEMNQKIRKAAQELFGKDKEQWPETYRGPFRNGDKKSDYDGYAGMVYVTMSTQTAPGMITRNKKRITAEEVKDVIYGGCYARAVVIAKAYQNGSNAGVTLYLQHIQKVEDGEPFGSKGNPENEFEDDLGEEDLDDIEDDDDGGF